MFLDQSIRTISLDGYVLVSRLDRKDGSGWGGICCFALTEFADSIVLLESSSLAERQWYILHTSCGPFYLINQYRPSNHGEIATINSLYDEIKSFEHDIFGIFLVGDCNVHSISWLDHSSHEFPEKYTLQSFCQQYGLNECVKQSTRNNYLIDFFDGFI